MRNAYRRWLRQRAREKSLDGNAEWDLERYMRIHAKIKTPLQIADQKEAHTRLRNALNRLEPLEGIIISRRYGFSGNEPPTYRDLEKFLGISRSTAQNIEKRALNKLRRFLS